MLRGAGIASIWNGYGRDFAAQVGDQAEAIEREVSGRMQPGVNPELVKRAVQDALEHRRSRW